MSSIFDAKRKEEIIARVSSLKTENQANWGKMNVFQML